MALYTRKGDDGKCALCGGGRVRKDDPRVTACGSVDELNAELGWVLACGLPEPMNRRLVVVQSRLFDIGAELAAPKKPAAGGFAGEPADRAVKELEGWIDEAESKVPPVKSFILPGGSEAAARLHLARTVCRRAERSVVTLNSPHESEESVLAFLNRLGDWLFALARVANADAGMDESQPRQ